MIRIGIGTRTITAQSIFQMQGTQAGQALSSTVGVFGFEDKERDALLALMEWVEKGGAPDHIVTTK